MVNETLRLHLVGPFGIPHPSVEDCTVLGYQIPRGTQLLVNLWEIGRNMKSHQLGTLVVHFVVAKLMHCFKWNLSHNMYVQELDMDERYVFTMPTSHDLFVVPTLHFTIVA